MLSGSVSEKDNMFVKEIFYNIGHSEIGYDHNTENAYGRSGYDNILNESLSGNEIYIEIREKILTMITITSTTLTRRLVTIFVGGCFKTLIKKGVGYFK